MEEMVNSTLKNAYSYLYFRYSYSDLNGDAYINWTEVENLTVEFFLKYIVRDRNNYKYMNSYHIDFFISLIYKSELDTQPYEVPLFRHPLFDRDTKYEDVKDKTIKECILDVINRVDKPVNNIIAQKALDDILQNKPYQKTL